MRYKNRPDIEPSRSGQPAVPAHMPVLVPKPAATIMLVRDAAHGMEVLMLQRNFDSAFVPGVHVFPGGTLDEEDESPALYAQCDGPDDVAASRMLGVAQGGL